MNKKIDISDRLGLPGKLDLITGEIEFGVSVKGTFTRTLIDVMKTGVVYKSEEIPLEAQNKVICRIYRFINDDVVTSLQGITPDSNNGVKFDITVLLPYSVIDIDWQGEYPKTTGHYHLNISGLDVASPDFYQVVHGKAEILLQRMVDKKIEALMVFPELLEPVLISPDLSHITINVGNEPLVFANVCVRAPHLNYDDIRRFNGGSYFVVRGEDGKPKHVLNRRYEEEGYTVSELKGLKPIGDIPELKIVNRKPIYEYIKQGGITLEMLTRPDRHVKSFENTFKSIS